MSFLRYLNEVRVAHVYQDLVNTEEPISYIMEKNGFTNRKLFNRTFRELYGTTPSAVRRGDKKYSKRGCHDGMPLCYFITCSLFFF